jgi:hypothetical protein
MICFVSNQERNHQADVEASERRAEALAAKAAEMMKPDKLYYPYQGFILLCMILESQDSQLDDIVKAILDKSAADLLDSMLHNKAAELAENYIKSHSGHY